MGAGRGNGTSSRSLPAVHRLRARYLLLVAGLLVAVLGLWHLMYYKSRKEDMIRDTSVKLSIMTEMAKDSVVSLMLGGQDRQLGLFIARSMTPELKAMRLITPDGKVISSTMASENNFVVRGLPLERKIITGADGIPQAMFTPIYNDRPCQTCHGTDGETLAVLNVELLNSGLAQRIGALRDGTLFSFAAAFLLIFAPIVFLYSRLVDGPVRGLKEAAKKAAGGSFDVRFKATGDDDLAGICTDLNQAFGQFRQMRAALEERHLEAMSKMEKMASLGELAAAVAHEIKNPLAGISGAIQVFAEDIPDSDPRKEIMQDILNEIDRLDQSVRSLLAYARPPTMRPVKVGIASVVERARGLLARQAEAQYVEIKMPAASDDVIVEADPEQMQQVFFSIMQNSLGLMPSGGVLEVSIEKGGGENDEDAVRVTISDTGMGMPEDDLKNIFRPFFTTKRSGAGLAGPGLAGSGLGLAISKNIVEQHGGRIEAGSRPGLGSTFHVIMQSHITTQKDG